MIGIEPARAGPARLRTGGPSDRDQDVASLDWLGIGLEARCDAKPATSLDGCSQAGAQRIGRGGDLGQWSRCDICDLLEGRLSAALAAGRIIPWEGVCRVLLFVGRHSLPEVGIVQQSFSDDLVGLGFSLLARPLCASAVLGRAAVSCRRHARSLAASTRQPKLVCA